MSFLKNLVSNSTTTTTSAVVIKSEKDLIRKDVQGVKSALILATVHHNKLSVDCTEEEAFQYLWNKAGNASKRRKKFGQNEALFRKVMERAVTSRWDDLPTERK